MRSTQLQSRLPVSRVVQYRLNQVPIRIPSLPFASSVVRNSRNPRGWSPVPAIQSRRSYPSEGASCGYIPEDLAQHLFTPSFQCRNLDKVPTSKVHVGNHASGAPSVNNRSHRLRVPMTLHSRRGTLSFMTAISISAGTLSAKLPNTMSVFFLISLRMTSECYKQIEEWKHWQTQGVVVEHRLVSRFGADLPPNWCHQSSSPKQLHLPF